MMDKKETDQAVDALIQWLYSQDISPLDAVPVLAKAMVAAVVSMSRGQPDLKVTADGVEAASSLVLQTFMDMLEDK